MKLPFYYIIILFLAIIVLHFAANMLGIYTAQIETGFVWFDDILHVSVGIAFGLLWLWILNRKKSSYSSLFIIFSTTIFVFFLALIWELIEFGVFKIFTSYAYSLNIYSPSTKEALLAYY